MNRFFVSLTLISGLIIAACSGGGTTLATDTSTHTLSGTVDSQVTTSSGTSSAPVSGATVHVIDFTGQDVSTATLTSGAPGKSGHEAPAIRLVTDSAGKYSIKVSKNTTYSVRVEKNGMVMKSLVKVADADATSHVNPGSSAAVLVFQKKFSVTIGEANTAFKAALENIDIAGTAEKIYSAATFGTLADKVKSIVAANANPFTDATAATQAQTVADSVTPVAITSISTDTSTSTATSTSTGTSTSTTTGTGTSTGTGTPFSYTGHCLYTFTSGPSECVNYSFSGTESSSSFTLNMTEVRYTSIPVGSWCAGTTTNSITNTSTSISTRFSNPTTVCTTNFGATDPATTSATAVSACTPTAYYCSSTGSMSGSNALGAVNTFTSVSTAH